MTAFLRTIGDCPKYSGELNSIVFKLRTMKKKKIHSSVDTAVGVRTLLV